MSKPSSHCYVVGALGAGGIVPLGFELRSCFIYEQKFLAKALLGLKCTINCKLAKSFDTVAPLLLIGATG